MSESAENEFIMALAMVVIKYRCTGDHRSVKDACNEMYDVLQPLDLSKPALKGTVPRKFKILDSGAVIRVHSLSTLIECLSALKFLCGFNNSSINLLHVYSLTYEADISIDCQSGATRSEIKQLFSLVTDTAINIFRHEINMRVMNFKCKGLMELYDSLLRLLGGLIEKNGVIKPDLVMCIYPHHYVCTMFRIVLWQLEVDVLNLASLLQYLSELDRLPSYACRILLDLADEFKTYTLKDQSRTTSKLYNSLPGIRHFEKLMQLFTRLICSYLVILEVPRKYQYEVRRELISVLLLYNRGSVLHEYQRFNFST